ncbi:hypothetical protein T10_3199 [Trichinella papuae]|uniref:Uncharacterized protein n=1 Tax=Trichinella papuae TaxID=268474 RepID=A0A0V1MPX3_9BILA|nr:hypothetical protein T10_3199 [Trichinella papuae]
MRNLDFIPQIAFNRFRSRARQAGAQVDELRSFAKTAMLVDSHLRLIPKRFELQVVWEQHQESLIPEKCLQIPSELDSVQWAKFLQTQQNMEHEL